MNEILLIIFITFNGTQDTELYEYPVESREKCHQMLSFASISEGVSAFCVLNKKQPTDQ